MNPFKINCSTGRLNLVIRDKPYFVRVTDSVHLGCKKGKSVSRWIVRWRIDNVYSTKTLQGAIPDDDLQANGFSVLSYEQAILKVTNMNLENLNQRVVLHCSFCSKPKNEVELLIAGKGSFICGACVNVCNDIIASGEKYSSSSSSHV